MTNIQTEVFCNLFNDLDSDQDNIISNYHINTKKLDSNILSIISPLLTEIKENNISLNKNKFIQAMNQLYKDLYFKDKHYLINYYKSKKSNINTNESETKCSNCNIINRIKIILV